MNEWGLGVTTPINDQAPTFGREFAPHKEVGGALVGHAPHPESFPARPRRSEGTGTPKNIPKTPQDTPNSPKAKRTPPDLSPRAVRGPLGIPQTHPGPLWDPQNRPGNSSGPPQTHGGHPQTHGGQPQTSAGTPGPPRDPSPRLFKDLGHPSSPRTHGRAPGTPPSDLRDPPPVTSVTPSDRRDAPQ